MITILSTMKTLLLGENWFVETSSNRASEIADRRLARLDEMIGQTKKQREMFQSRGSFTKGGLFLTCSSDCASLIGVCKLVSSIAWR